MLYGVKLPAVISCWLEWRIGGIAWGQVDKKSHQSNALPK